MEAGAAPWESLWSAAVVVRTITARAKIATTIDHVLTLRTFRLPAMQAATDWQRPAADPPIFLSIPAFSAAEWRCL
jgi:hypothetical protein